MLLLSLLWLHQASAAAAAAASTHHNDQHKQPSHDEICLSTPLTTPSSLRCESPRSSRHAPYPPQGRHKRTFPSLPGTWRSTGDCVDEYCVFYNTEYLLNPNSSPPPPSSYENQNENEHSITLVTSPSNLDVIDSFPPTRDPASLHNSQPPAFYSTQIPGKGVGLIANRTIRKGEAVLQQTAAMLVQFGPHLDLSASDRDMLYAKAVGMLPRERRAGFMRQMGRDVFTKVDRNAFRLFVNGGERYSGHLGCFPGVSRMNHDCRPNTHYRIENITHTTVAIRDIAPGEEITISYIDGTLPHADRQKRLDDWGFKCSCQQCSLPPAERAESDERLRQIERLEEEMEDKVRTRDPGLTPELGLKLVKLYEDERLQTYLGQAYTRAALIFSMHGDERNTTKYATLAAETVAVEFGERAKDVVAMRQLAKNPRGHWSWGVRVQQQEKPKEAGAKGGKGKAEEAGEKKDGKGDKTKTKEEKSKTAESEKPSISWRVL